MTAKVIAISSNKGGVLKTSIATNLAGVLSTDNKKVLIIDTDSQSNVAVTFGINPDEFEEKLDKTIYDMLTSQTNQHDYRQAIKNVSPNLDLLATDDSMIQFEFNVLMNVEDYGTQNLFNLLKNVIDPIREDYDFIIIDTPPNLGLMQGNVLMAADEIIIPFQPEIYAMRSLIKTLDLFEQFKEDHNHDLKILAIVPTMVRPNTIIHRSLLASLKSSSQLSGHKISKNYIPNSIQYPTIVALENSPITISKPNSKLSKIYKDLSIELGLIEVNKVE